MLLTALMCGLLAGFGKAAPPTTLVRSWFPVEVGNRWVYQHERREAGRRGMADPMVERWKTEETVSSVAGVANGTLVVETVRVYDHERLNGWLPENDGTTHVGPLERLLVHQNCVYRDGDTYRDPDGEDTPSLCFPMTVGGRWGRSAATSPGLEDVWHVRGLNGDPFGIPNARNYHAVAYEGSGTVQDIWYAQGIGEVQTITEHHGTYLEDRAQLLSTTFGRRTRHYTLTPAKTVPLGEFDCRGYGWRHFARSDGAGFVSQNDCVAAVRRGSDPMR